MESGRECQKLIAAMANECCYADVGNDGIANTLTVGSQEGRRIGAGRLNSSSEYEGALPLTML